MKRGISSLKFYFVVSIVFEIQPCYYRHQRGRAEGRYYRIVFYEFRLWLVTQSSFAKKKGIFEGKRLRLGNPPPLPKNKKRKAILAQRRLLKKIVQGEPWGKSSYANFCPPKQLNLKIMVRPQYKAFVL